MKLRYKIMIAVYIIGFWSMVGHERVFHAPNSLEPDIEAFFKAVVWPSVILTRISTRLWELTK